MAGAAALALPVPLYTISTSIEAREAIPSISIASGSFQKRQACAETCGNVCYYQSTIDRAVSAGYKLYQQNQQKGDYPHLYHNYEGFDFGVPGPYQEYPIMSDFDAYEGGSPGADRVIFNTKGALAGTVTHTGASGNDFIECDG